MKNIVIIGGGTGTYTLLSGLRKFPSNNSVIVSGADDGGSTGRLRKDLGVFPPGDLRQCLLGLSYTEDSMKRLFAYRFDKGELRGHTVGNIVLAALEKTSGNIETAVELVAKMLNVRGRVLPVTLKPTRLTAVLKDGKKVVGEHYIDEPSSPHSAPIKSLSLTKAKANPKAVEAILKADTVVFGPGDLYTSTLPNLLVKEINRALAKSRALKVLVTNIMTKQGQTDGFTAVDFIKVVNKYLKMGGSKSQVDALVVNIQKPAVRQMLKYRKHKSQWVSPELKGLRQFKIKISAGKLIAQNTFEKANGDGLQRSFLRHDADKTARIIWEL